MKIKHITIIIIILILMLILWLSGLRFSTTYGIGRNISIEKLSEIDCVWKSCNGRVIAGTDGFHKKGCEIKNDTLCLFGKPVAKPISLVRRYFARDYELTIESFDGKQKGSYISK